MSGRVPQLETLQQQSSENVDCTDRPWDWECQAEKYQTNTSPVPDTPGAADIGAVTERPIIKMTMNTERSGLLHSTEQPSVGYERSTPVITDGASGSVTAAGSDDGGQDNVSLALHAALAALGVLIVLLIILIVYFGYFRKRQRGQGTDSENGSGMDNYAYSKHKRIPYSLQGDRLSVIPELSEHDSESQYEYVEPASGAHLNLPTFLVTDHSMNPDYDYSDPDNQTEHLNPSADKEAGLYDYVDPATVHTKFPGSDTLTGVVNPAHIDIDSETSLQPITTDTQSKEPITADSEINEPIPTEPRSNNMTESESSGATIYQAMLPSNDLNQHVYASSCDVESISTETTTATPAHSEPVSDSTPSAASTPAAAVDNNIYNICEPEEEPGEDNSVYEALSDGETNNDSS